MPTGCVLAIEYLLDKFDDRRCDDSIEFYDVRDDPPDTPAIHPRQKTPLKVTREVCSVAIVMLDRFTPAQLPGKSGKWPRSPTEVASYSEVESSLYRIYDACCTPEDVPGWLPFGTLIHVFQRMLRLPSL